MADAGRRPGPNAVAVLVLIVLGVALLLWQRPWQSSDDAAVALPPDAASRLATQLRALSEAGSQAEFVAAAGTTRRSREIARDAWSACRSLGIDDIGFRYISGGDVPDRADGSAVAMVDVSWSAGDGPGTASVALRVAPQRDGGLAIVDVERGADALPVWLAGVVDVRRERGSVVVRVDGGDDDLAVDSMAARARAAVTGLVKGTTGDVTVVSPRSREQMADLVGQDAEQVAQIAAVTTRVEGAGVAGTAIVLNPEVFDTMDERAAQVVMTHEATHLLTRAAARAESWVVEGFADYVALHDDRAPLSVSAGQVLEQVRAGDLPARLPTAKDFGAQRHGLGAVYESAWMVFRMLDERHDEADVVAFYRAVRAGTPVDDALRRSFGLTVRELTSSWRRYLSKSASTVS